MRWIIELLIIVDKDDIFIVSRSFDKSNKEFIVLISEVKDKRFLNVFEVDWILNIGWFGCGWYAKLRKWSKITLLEDIP